MTSKMTPIEVKDVTLASIALRELVEQSEQSGNSQVSIDDATRRKVKNLTQLPFSQAVEIATESIQVHIAFNDEAFEAALRKSRILNTEQDYYEWMISVGASNSLLKTLFPSLADKAQNAMLRRVLTAGTTFKKISLIKETSVKQDISNHYFLLSKQIKLQEYERIRELYLHYGGKYNLVQLYAVLKEYDLI